MLDKNEDVIFELLHEIALETAQEIQEELASKKAIVQSDGANLTSVPYNTTIEDDGENVSVVPTFDNSIDEYSNSNMIEKHGFDGNFTLTKLADKLSKR